MLYDFIPKDLNIIVISGWPVTEGSSLILQRRIKILMVIDLEIKAS